jgi:hypothetical protein
MCITFVHYFHTDTSAVQHIGPSTDYTTLRIENRLVEVETVEVERHGANTHCRKPDTDYRPSTQEEVQGAAIVERSVLED